jgi:hypothetical protein
MVDKLLYARMCTSFIWLNPVHRNATMKYSWQLIAVRTVFIFSFFLFVRTAFSQASTSQERTLEALKQSGIVRQEGSTLIYKVQKASDTAQVRLLYSNLLNDPGYQVKFEVAGQKPVKVNTPVTNVPKTNLPIISNTANNQGSGTSDSPNCCFCNMKTFQYVGMGSDRTVANPFSEHSWIVPAGVTKIKFEAWSAGGNGGNRNLRGGGGGGGAYVSGIIEVSGGMTLKIRIPGGGSAYPLIVQSEPGGVGYLSVESGQNAQKTNDDTFNGRGGRLLQSTGMFSGTVVNFQGENGLPSYLLDFNKGGSIAQKVFFGNDGGASPRGGFAGKGALYSDQDSRSRCFATDGSFPGGGGGGGDLYFSQPEQNKSGRGAAGLLIIYY